MKTQLNMHVWNLTRFVGGGSTHIGCDHFHLQELFTICSSNVQQYAFIFLIYGYNNGNGAEHLRAKLNAKVK